MVFRLHGYRTRSTTVSSSIGLCCLFYFLHLSLYGGPLVLPVAHDNANLNHAPRELVQLEEGEFCALLNALAGDWPRVLLQGDVSCDITLVTQASLNYLPSLLELSARWTGPISVALYVGNASHVPEALHGLQLLADWNTRFGSQARVHLLWPSSVQSGCQLPAQPTAGAPTTSGCGQHLKNSTCVTDELARLAADIDPLTYPVNVARNTARTRLATAFEMVADVELQPSLGLCPLMTEYLSSHSQQQSDVVYVVPSFEVAATVTRLPASKAELVSCIHNGSAVPFHFLKVGRSVEIFPKAQQCHQIPHLGQWLSRRSLDKAEVLHSTRWLRPCWEPVYVAARALAPAYDTRFRGYGRNKIQQLYEMCRANFTFSVMDGVYLMHRRIARWDAEKWRRVRDTVLANNRRYERFVDELDRVYPDESLKQYCDNVPHGKDARVIATVDVLR